MTDWQTQLHIYRILKKIEKGHLSLKWLNPENGSWMGDLHYGISNGYKITIFSDCFSFDYIDNICDKDGNVIFKFERDLLRIPAIAEYYPPHEIEENVYMISSKNS